MSKELFKKHVIRSISYLNSILLGAMLFFVIIVSPTVFTALSNDKQVNFKINFSRLFLFINFFDYSIRIQCFGLYIEIKH